MEAVVSTAGGVFVWGGLCANLAPCGDGAIYSATSDSWSPVVAAGSPSPRYAPFAFSTQTEVMVWGGAHLSGGMGTAVWDGAAYNFTMGSWRPLSGTGAPSSRLGAATAWTGSDMLVWGGADAADTPLGDGAIFHLATNTWEPIEAAGAPSARFDPTSLWMGTEMLVFGGRGCGGRDDTGAFKLCNDAGFAYDPVRRQWRTIAGGLAPRTVPIAVWTGSSAFIWGGVGNCCSGSDCTCTDGGLYDPVADAWRAVPSDGAPQGDGTGYWIGDSVLVISNAGAPGRYFPP